MAADILGSHLPQFATLALSTWAVVQAVSNKHPFLKSHKEELALVVGPILAVVAKALNYLPVIETTGVIGYLQAAFLGFVGTLTAKFFNDWVVDPIRDKFFPIEGK